MTAPNPRCHGQICSSLSVFSPPTPMPTKPTAQLGTPVTGLRGLLLSAGIVYATWVWAPPPQPHLVNLALLAAPLLSRTLRPSPLHPATQTSPAQLCPNILQFLGRQSSPSGPQQLNDTLMPAMEKG